MNQAFLLHDGTLNLDPLLEAFPDLHALRFGQDPLPDNAARVLVYLNDENIKQVWAEVQSRDWELGLLPHPESKYAARAFSAPGGKIPELIAQLLEAKPVAIDSLSCNGTPVFSSIIIGELLVFNLKDTSHALSRWHALTTMVARFRQLQLHAYELMTATEQRLQVALLGMMLMEQNHKPMFGRGLQDILDAGDRRLSLVAVAPRSVTAFLWLLLKFLFSGRFSSRNLPDSIGVLRTQKLTIASGKGINYQLDGIALGAKSLQCEVQEKSVRMLQLQNRERGNTDIRKDQIRMAHLPCGSAVMELADKPLPMFHHASEDEFRELFRSLRENAIASPAFLMLMVLSVLLAVTGLFANSAPVIIGAMILAPLMSPIISLAMGLARADTGLVQSASKTLLGGVSLALLCAILATWMIPLTTLTSEMQSRMTPTLLDLGVAVISGIAGAYANAKEEVARSLAGVAIAVALVPPLSVVGIGLGWGDLAMAGGAMLLFTTNLVGIALSAALTFLVLGFAPFHLARKGMGVSLGFLAIIAIPLFLSFDDLVEKSRIYRVLPQGKVQLLEQEVELTPLDVTLGQSPRISYKLVSPTQLNDRHLDALKQIIQDKIETEVELEAELRLRR
ncbi:TIGR00341 family protein [Bowmanella dokdonensis]|uniref:TIGR00341 family protein n=1 Tax=Bowmanella dokdonensis TaxID=751969 RepID=A0A939IQ70_9ALTE|nr:TIGR00341 family protein [Bowmanella dokdonensis]MBN7826620.1 TIGR00341 family protein [Bowmanella dokdonensis]